MDAFLTQESFFQSVSVIFAEIIILIIGIYFVNAFLNMLLRKLAGVRYFKKQSKIFDRMRQSVKSMLSLICFIFCGCIVVLNGYLISNNINVFTYTKRLFYVIPVGFWVDLSAGVGKIIALIIFAAVLTRRIHQILNRLMKKTKSLGRIKANDESIESFFCQLNQIQRNTIWLLLLALIALILPFPGLINYAFIIVKVYLIIALGLLVVKAVTAVVDTLDVLSKKYTKTDTLLALYDQLKVLIPLLRRSLEYVVYISVATLVMLQVEFIAKFAEYGQRIIQIIGIVFLSRVFIEVTNLVINNTMLKSTEGSEVDQQKRLTLVPLARSFLKYLIYFTAFILILKVWGINPTPIMAGAGILGVVIGLGAQPLINDIVSGFFILFENLYLVGDYIETSVASGIVEAIEIRTTQIRSLNGQLYILRNGQINEIINFSKGFINAIVEVGVDYNSDLEHVYKVLHDIGLKLKETNKDVLEVTKVDGLKDFGESQLTIRTVTRVKPGRHKSVGFQLRRMIKEAFDKENIEIPFARRVVIFKNSPPQDK
ncbi:MAG: mechanosensitive ion channel family protein [Candidatus Omnitrophota bacterium]